MDGSSNTHSNPLIIMKTIAVFTICILVLSGCTYHDLDLYKPVAIPLDNVDMESGSGTPDSWFPGHTANDISMTWTTEAASSPTHSLAMSRASFSDPNSFAAWGQTYQGAMPVGKNLTLSVKVKGVNLVGQGLSIAIRVDGATGSNLQFSSTQNNISITGTFDWTTYSIALPNLTSGKYIDVYLVYLPGTTGKAYFDDISLMYN